MEYEYEYTLDILGSRKIHRTFSSYDEFKKETESYFGPDDEEAVKRLTSFPDDKWSKPDKTGWQEQRHNYAQYRTSAGRWPKTD